EGRMAEGDPREPSVADQVDSSGSQSEPTRAMQLRVQGARAGFVSIGTKLGVAVVFVMTMTTALAFAWFTARERDAMVEAKRKTADMVTDLFAASLRAAL